MTHFTESKEEYVGSQWDSLFFESFWKHIAVWTHSANQQVFTQRNTKKHSFKEHLKGKSLEVNREAPVSP